MTPEQIKALVDEQLKKSAAPKAPEVGPGEHFVNKTLDMIPFTTQATNIITALGLQAAKQLGVGKPGVSLTPQAQAEMQAQGMAPPSTESTIPGLLDAYRQIRDTRNQRLDVGAEQNPWADKFARGWGFLLSMGVPLPKGLQAAQAVKGANPISNILRMGKQGALIGGAGALSDSRADLTTFDPMQYAKAGLEVLGGSTLGGVGGMLLPKILPPVFQGAQKGLEKLGVRFGRQVVTKGAGAAGDIPDEAVIEALRGGAIRPLGTTGGAAERLAQQTAKTSQAYDDVLAQFKDSIGPNTRALANELLARAKQIRPNTMDPRVSQTYVDAANELLEKSAQARELNPNQPMARLMMQQAEKLQKSLQARADAAKGDSALNKAYEDIASIFRKANEQEVANIGQAAGPNTPLGQAAKDFVPLQQKLNRLEPAKKAAEMAAEKAAMKPIINWQDLLFGALTGDPLKGGGVALTSALLRPRLASTAAAIPYWLGTAQPDYSRMGGLLGNEVQQQIARALMTETLRQSTQKGW